jgi:hypothetical protein
MWEERKEASVVEAVLCQLESIILHPSTNYLAVSE